VATDTCLAFIASSSCGKVWYGEFGLTLTIDTLVTARYRLKSSTLLLIMPSTG